jgi:hypothetical protein
MFLSDGMTSRSLWMSCLSLGRSMGLTSLFM